MMLIYNKYKTIVLELFRTEKFFLFLLSLVAIAGYGFTFTNFSISTDDLYVAYDYANHATRIYLPQGRWGSAIFGALFGNMLVQPFFGDFIGVLSLCAAIITWAVLLREASNNRLRRNEYISFSLIFISYPLINEIFIWVGASFNISVGYLLTGLALILSYEAIIKNATGWASLLSVLVLATSIAIYESFAAVFLCGIFCVLLLCFIFNENLEKSIKVYTSLLFQYCLLLFFAVALKTVISALIIRILHLSAAESGAANQIYWLSKDYVLVELFAKLLSGIAYWFVYNSLFYQPVFTFVVACMLALFFAVLMRRKYKSTVPLFLFGGLLLSNLALSLIQGAATPYKSCQSFAIFVAFIGMLSCVFVREKAKMMLALNVIIFFVIYWQARELNLWFYNDFHRFEMDRINFINVAQEIERTCGKNSSKPVVFIGEPPRYNTLRGDIVNPKLRFLPKYILTSRTNGVSLFGRFHGDEFFLFMDYYGFKFKMPNDLQISKGLERIKELKIPAYPRDGCAREFPDSIVVNLGEPNNEDSKPGRTGRQIIELIRSFNQGRNSK